MNVHDMNGKNTDNQDSYKYLLFLDEISKGEALSQRDLSNKLNIALGLVNSYIKNLVSKGYVTISQIPAKRYVYYLTPTGFAEKTRLTYKLLQDYTNIYREARRDFKKLFQGLHKNGIRKVAFAGVDEVAEIAYLSLQEVDLELMGVFDDTKAGRYFFKNIVRPFHEVQGIDYDRMILSTFLKREQVYRCLLENRVSEEKILAIYDVASTDHRKAGS